MSTLPDLSIAVSDTVNKLLDAPPAFVKFPPCRLHAVRRAYALLKDLGYAKDKYRPRTKKHGDWVKTAHPKAIAYLDEYGEKYVQCLEATLRLMNPNLNP